MPLLLTTPKSSQNHSIEKQIINYERYKEIAFRFVFSGVQVAITSALFVTNRNFCFQSESFIGLKVVAKEQV